VSARHEKQDRGGLAGLSRRAVGLHRFYLRGPRDVLGWLMPIPTAWACGACSGCRNGLDDPLSCCCPCWAFTSRAARCAPSSTGSARREMECPPQPACRPTRRAAAPTGARWRRWRRRC
jgi:hypothetical protein